MELWIRSQKNDNLRPMLLKVNEFEIGDYDDDMNCIVVNNLHCVGIYKSKERALQVLDEIQRILQPMIKTHTPLTDSKEDYKNHCMKTELVGYETTYDIVGLPTYVYEMPKD